LPDSLLWFLEGALPGQRRRLRALMELVTDYVGRTLGHRSSNGRPGLAVSSLVAGGRTPNAVPFLGMGTDQAGQLRLRGDELDVSWSARRNRDLYRAMQQVMSDVSGGAGGHFVTSFLWRWPFRKILTAHPLGGCPMGDDPRTSVVDDRCEVWGHPGLFVTDGSVIPGPLAVNPSLTIAAVAERAMSHLTAR
jgi:cholesterol oxidase